MRFTTKDSRDLERVIQKFARTSPDSPHGDMLNEYDRLIKDRSEILLDRTKTKGFTHLMTMYFDLVNLSDKYSEPCKKKRFQDPLDRFTKLELPPTKYAVANKIDRLYRPISEVEATIKAQLLTATGNNHGNALHYVMWAGLRENVMEFLLDLEQLIKDEILPATAFKDVFCAKTDKHFHVLHFATKSGAPDNLDYLFEKAQDACLAGYLTQEDWRDLLTYSEAEHDVSFLRSLVLTTPGMLKTGMRLLEEAYRKGTIGDLQYYAMHERMNARGETPLHSLILDANCEVLTVYLDNIHNSHCSGVVGFYVDNVLLSHQLLSFSIQCALQHWDDESLRHKYLDVVRCLWFELDHARVIYPNAKKDYVNHALSDINSPEKRQFIAAFFRDLTAETYKTYSLRIFDQPESRRQQSSNVSLPTEQIQRPIHQNFPPLPPPVAMPLLMPPPLPPMFVPMLLPELPPPAPCYMPYLRQNYNPNTMFGYGYVPPTLPFTDTYYTEQSQVGNEDACYESVYDDYSSEMRY